MSRPASGSERRPGNEVTTEGDAHECHYCGRPFTREDLLALHRGHTHPEELTDEELAAFEDAYEDEQAEIRLFRLKALGLLVVLYFGFLILYAVV